MPLFGYPNFGVTRAGLGNLLVMWAKCEVFCRDHGGRVIAPQWTQPKVGPLLRRERDLRFYTGLFRTPADHVRGLRRLALLLRAKRVNEKDAAPALLADATAVGADPLVVEFASELGFFSTLLGDRAFLAARLDAMLSDKTRRAVATHRPAGRFIAAHVRRGDKPTLAPGAPLPDHPNWALPDEWFVRTIESARRAVGEPVPVRIFSDARPAELSRLLAVPDVRLVASGNAMADILLLSEASTLITSGTSSFSMWAGFLGGMPTVWFPSLRMVLSGDRAGSAVETDLDGTVPEAFAREYAAFTAALV